MDAANNIVKSERVFESQRWIFIQGRVWGENGSRV